MRVVQHWKRLVRDAVGFTALEIFHTQLEKALCYLGN